MYRKINDNLWEHDLLRFGDYDNSCAVERSNVRVWMDEFAESRGKIWEHHYGLYGYEAINFLVDPEELIKNNTPEGEALAGLESYPVLNDEDMCFLEMEMIDEALRSYALGGIIHALGNLDYEAEEYFQGLQEEQQMDLVYQAMHSADITPHIEAGGIVYIDESEVAEALLEDTKKQIK
jgi:hypothetical protein